MLVIYLFVFIIGAIFGSFFNVCIHRIPNKESIVFPASHCPACNSHIKPYHNIPLLSFIFLKGKCNYCGAKISIRYFWVELITAILYVLAFKANNSIFDLELLENIIFISFSIIIFFIDWEKGLIPDVLNLPLLGIGIIFSLFKIKLVILQSLIGGGVIFILLMIIAYTCEIIKKKNCIGGGDIKYLVAIGTGFGLVHTFFIMFFASVFALIFLIVTKFDLKKSFPFGPFLAISAVLNIFFGNAIVKFYIDNLIHNPIW